jgi:hypothetical protein
MGNEFIHYALIHYVPYTMHHTLYTIHYVHYTMQVGSSVEWTTDVARFIKGECGAKQLVMDGRDEIRSANTH